MTKSSQVTFLAILFLLVASLLYDLFYEIATMVLVLRVKFNKFL